MMPWYYSPIVYFLFASWIWTYIKLSNWNTGNEGGMILKFVVFVVVGLASLVLFGLSYWIGMSKWEYWKIISIELGVVVLLIVCLGIRLS